MFTFLKLFIFKSLTFVLLAVQFTVTVYSNVDEMVYKNIEQFSESRKQRFNISTLSIYVFYLVESKLKIAEYFLAIRKISNRGLEYYFIVKQKFLPTQMSIALVGFRSLCIIEDDGIIWARRWVITATRQNITEHQTPTEIMHYVPDRSLLFRIQSRCHTANLCVGMRQDDPLPSTSRRFVDIGPAYGLGLKIL